nr:Cytochrome b c1 complex subunit 2 [Hymenolepis microstoma]
MNSVNISRLLKIPIRNAANPALKMYEEANEQAISILERDGGMKYACVPKPNMWNGLTRIMAVFNAGSRFENRPHLHGITHLIRRSCGLSTTDYTAVNLTRHVQQMGGQLHCHTTREQMIYSIDVAPNLASRAGLILATIATKTTFYDWELKDNVYKLMKKDLDMLNRRRFDALTIELLHEAAYGQHPDGIGLGLTDLRILNPSTTPTLLLLMPFSLSLDVDQNLRAFKSLTQCERRREITGADTTYAALVWPTTGGHLSTSPDAMALTVLAAAITPPRKTIAYGSTGNFMPPSPDALAMPLNFSYSDHGLFGLLVTGSNGQVVGEHLVNAMKALRMLAQTGLSEKQFANAKARLIMEAISKSEDINQLTGDIAFQLLCASRNGEKKGGDICSLFDLKAAVESVKLDDVNRILAKTVTSGKMALATVGTDTAYVPPLDALKSL